MISIFLKELSSFFSSLIGILVLSIFTIVMGLFLWVFPETSILDYGYAGLDQLFSMAPVIYLFLIPALTMRAFAEERMSGTIEFLGTKPVSDLQIILGKYLASAVLVLIALVPTLLYLWTVYELSTPRGNIDTGAIAGSYIGLILLGCSFVAIGMWSSVLSKNQIVAFLLSTFLCFLFYWGFDYLSQLPVFFGRFDLIVEKIGIDHHYRALSKGVLDSSNIVYFVCLITFMIVLCVDALNKAKSQGI